MEKCLTARKDDFSFCSTNTHMVLGYYFGLRATLCHPFAPVTAHCSILYIQFHHPPCIVASWNIPWAERHCAERISSNVRWNEPSRKYSSQCVDRLFTFGTTIKSTNCNLWTVSLVHSSRPKSRSHSSRTRSRLNVSDVVLEAWHRGQILWPWRQRSRPWELCWQFLASPSNLNKLRLVIIINQ